MATPFQIALVAGVAIASVHAYFARREGGDRARVIRTFLAWLLAFVVAGLIAQPLAAWLLTNVF
jgi:hypothetical protein